MARIDSEASGGEHSRPAGGRIRAHPRHGARRRRRPARRAADHRGRPRGELSIAWLVWHLTRLQDDHVSGVATEPAWTADGWRDRFGLPFPAGDVGYGHASDDVAAVRAEAADLVGYQDAVHGRTVGYVGQLRDADLDRVVDEAWDPPERGASGHFGREMASYR